MPSVAASGSASGRTDIVVVGVAVAAAAAACLVVGGGVWLWTSRRWCHRTDDGGGSTPSRSAELLPPHMRREVYKEQRRRENVRVLSRKTPMYDNIEMYGPDGATMLCTVGKKKARWYVGKDLAVWMSSSSPPPPAGGGEPHQDPSSPSSRSAIRLLFEPKSGHHHKPASSVLYDTSHKRNVCVACGSPDGLVRHYVVPYAYRRLLPHRHKSHLPHDVVLLCLDCHLCAETAGREKREDEYERTLRLDPDTAPAVLPDRHLRRVRSCAKALLKHSAALPPERRQEYERVVEEHLQQRGTSLLSTTTSTATTMAQHSAPSASAGNGAMVMGLPAAAAAAAAVVVLEELSRMDTDFPNPRHVPIADLVVATLWSDEEVARFVRDWRRLFLETLSPRYLPVGWSVGSPVQNDTADDLEQGAGLGNFPPSATATAADDDDDHDDHGDNVEDSEVNSSRCCNLDENSSHSTIASGDGMLYQGNTNEHETIGHESTIRCVDMPAKIQLFWTAVNERDSKDTPSLLQSTVSFCGTERTRNRGHREGETPSAALALAEAAELRQRFTDNVVRARGSTKEQETWQDLSNDDRDEFLSRLFLPRGLGGLI